VDPEAAAARARIDKLNESIKEILEEGRKTGFNWKGFTLQNLDSYFGFDKVTLDALNQLRIDDPAAYTNITRNYVEWMGNARSAIVSKNQAEFAEAVQKLTQAKADVERQVAQRVKADREEKIAAEEKERVRLEEVRKKETAAKVQKEDAALRGELRQMYGKAREARKTSDWGTWDEVDASKRRVGELAEKLSATVKEAGPDDNKRALTLLKAVEKELPKVGQRGLGGFVRSVVNLVKRGGTPATLAASVVGTVLLDAVFGRISRSVTSRVGLPSNEERMQLEAVEAAKTIPGRTTRDIMLDYLLQRNLAMKQQMSGVPTMNLMQAFMRNTAEPPGTPGTHYAGDHWGLSQVRRGVPIEALVEGVSQGTPQGVP